MNDLAQLFRRWFRRPLRYACLRRAEAWTLHMLSPLQPPHFVSEAHRRLWDLYTSGALSYDAYAYEVESLDPSVCDHNWVFDANTGWRCYSCGDPKPGQADPSAVYDSEWREHICPITSNGMEFPMQDIPKSPAVDAYLNTVTTP